jgi:tRNA threonylcarbamoyladenosine biosynthesis protein TsaB
MPSLRLLLADHPTLLLIDSASAHVQVGLWTAGNSAPAQWSASQSEAGTGVFDCVESLLNQNGLRIADMSAFVFCEGPGSVLGIRTAAVALRAWQVINPTAPAYTYQSLDLVARALNQPELRVIADARRETWHVAQVGQALKRVPTAELSGELTMPEHFRHWTALPASVSITPYAVAKLFAQLVDADILHRTGAPDAFLHEDPTYVTWTPQIHQSPRPAG